MSDFPAEIYCFTTNSTQVDAQVSAAHTDDQVSIDGHGDGARQAQNPDGLFDFICDEKSHRGIKEGEETAAFRRGRSVDVGLGEMASNFVEGSACTGGKFVCAWVHPAGPRNHTPTHDGPPEPASKEHVHVHATKRPSSRFGQLEIGDAIPCNTALGLTELAPAGVPHCFASSPNSTPQLLSQTRCRDGILLSVVT